MSDAGADPGLETVEHPSSLTPVNQSHRRRLWPRIAGVFRTSDWTALFTGVLAIATIALVGTSIWLHTDTVEVLKATNRLAEATEKAAADRRQTASAEFILKIDAMLEEHRYDRITDDIQSHDSNYQLPKYKNKSDADVNEYVSIFEDMGYFVTENLIGAKMTYEHLPYDIEKAWCNTTVQETIQKERATDKSKTARSDPMYGNFERLAKEYLETDGQSCKDLDSDAAKVQKKKSQ